MAQNTNLIGKPVSIGGRFVRVVKLRDEYYDFVETPEQFIAAAKSSRPRLDLLTFTQDVTCTDPRFSYHLAWDEAAVLSISTYEHWWKKQINDKTRNMVRKAGKAGVEIRATSFDDDLVRGIEILYNESPLRQGRRFKHFGKKFEQIKREHSTFLDKSEFYGAYHQGELIGFIKLVHRVGVTNLMNIFSAIRHRDKAPTNALLAKAVEVCAERGVPKLQYGSWSRRSMGDFKKHHAFDRVEVPRYYVPLSARGNVALRFQLHLPIEDRLPGTWVDKLADLRTKWNYYRYSDGAFPFSFARPKQKHA